LPDSKDTGEKPWRPEQLVAWRDARHEDALWHAAISLGVVPVNAQLETETYLPIQVIRERLLERAYAAGGKRAREHRLGMRFDEEGFEHRDAHEELPDGLCSADMMAAYGIVKAALDAAFSNEAGGF
jgi:hypothetical protein